MVELLAKNSKLLVIEAKNDMFVKANQVYLTPANKYISIRHGKLYLIPFIFINWFKLFL